MKATISKKLQKTFKACVLAAVIATVLLAVLPTTALSANGTRGATLFIPVEQIFSVIKGGEKEASFSYELTRLDASLPLPIVGTEAATGDNFNFILTGSEVKDIGPLNFTHGGLYAYEIRSTSTQEPRFTLDNTIYTVIIAVANIADGELSAEIRAVYTRPSGTSAEKKIPLESGRITFNKKYEASTTDEPKTDPPPRKEIPPAESTRGPKTGDYTDPASLLAAMAISAAIVLFTLFLIYIDRKSEKDHPTSAC